MNQEHKNNIEKPTKIPINNKCKKIQTGPYHTYLITDEEIIHLGMKHSCKNKDNQSNQVNDNDQKESNITVLPIKVQDIATNQNHTFAWNSQHVYCWGSNLSYELGLTSQIYYQIQHMPTLEHAIIQGYQLKQISCGEHHTLALFNAPQKQEKEINYDIQTEVYQQSQQEYDDSSQIQLYAWGQSQSHQLTINSLNIIPYPVLSPCSFRHLDHIYSRSDYNLALCNGKIYSWGCNLFSRLGQPIPSSQLSKLRIPKQIVLPIKVVKIGIGTYHAVAVGEKGDAYAWGKGIQGQLGIDRFQTESIPTKMVCQQRIIDVSCGESHTLVLLQDGRLKTCGGNAYKVLGHNEYTTKGRKERCKKLQLVNETQNIGEIAQISCGNNHNIVLNDKGQVFGWGSNTHAQILPMNIEKRSQQQNQKHKKNNSQQKQKKSSSFRQHKSIQLQIQIQYDKNSKKGQNSSKNIKLQEWKQRYTKFLQQKHKQQQILLNQLDQLLKSNTQ